MPDKRKHSLGGRIYREAAKSTIAHDVWVLDLVRATGLDRMRREPDEDFGDYGLRITNAVLGSGKALELLAGLLLPEEVEDLAWTPEIALRTARMLGEVSEPDEKAEIAALIGTLVAGFFVEGVLSDAIFQSSSARPTAPSDSNGIAES